jgi:sugar O-acyltransferase (sialic acid O-acetyltransferase NeuD family)
MDEIILVGSGGHARACIDVIEMTEQFKVAGLIDKTKTDNKENLGYPLIGVDKDLQSMRKKYSHAIITVGQIKSTQTRVKLFKILQKMNYILPVIISPNAYVSKNAHIGDGTIVMHGAIVNANARIGKNCIINNLALIEHDVIIGNHCHIATGAVINGEVSVGDETFIGSGVVTKQCIAIGSNCVIGSGAVVKKNIASNQVLKN